MLTYIKDSPRIQEEAMDTSRNVTNVKSRETFEMRVLFLIQQKRIFQMFAL